MTSVPAMRRLPRAPLLVFAVLVLVPAARSLAGSVYEQRNLVSDGFVPAEHTDDNLKNPWGMAASPDGGPFWIANQVTGTSTVYNSEGEPFPVGAPLVVRTPQNTTGPAGPTGTAFNVTNSFNLTTGGKTGKGLFFFANLDGSISGWNPSGDQTQAVRVVAPAAGTVYTGLTIVSNTGGDFILAANNATGKVDVFDTDFRKTTLAGDFTDPQVPAGLVPFNVKRVGQRVFVTYAIPGEEAGEVDLGSGAVAEFTADGQLVRHIATGGQLASPWGVTIAPQTFGEFAGALLVGNFNEDHGVVNAFDATTGGFLGTLLGRNGQPIANPYLWAINFGNGGDGGRADTLYLVAGVGEEEHGLFASVSNAGTTAIPLPPAALAAPAVIALTLSASRRMRRRL